MIALIHAKRRQEEAAKKRRKEAAKKDRQRERVRQLKSAEATLHINEAAARRLRQDLTQREEDELQEPPALPSALSDTILMAGR